MKNFLGTAIITLMLSVNAYSEIKLLEREFIKSHDAGTYVSKVCIDQYEYIFLSARIYDHTDTSRVSNSIVQSFEIANGKSLPKKCK